MGIEVRDVDGDGLDKMGRVEGMVEMQDNLEDIECGCCGLCRCIGDCCSGGYC